MCEVPGLQTAGRVCVDCHNAVDPLHPSNIYLQHCVRIFISKKSKKNILKKKQERKAQQQASKFYGLAAGEEHLPLQERKIKIMDQLKEITDLINQTHNAQDGLKRLVDLYKDDSAQQIATISEIEEGEQKLREWDETKKELTDLLRKMDDEFE